MAELTEPTSTAPSSCCSTEAQQSCCEPSEKDACCGTSASTGSCGCSAGEAESPEDIRETVREKYAARRPCRRRAAVVRVVLRSHRAH